jgi:hypothetical protein
VTPMAAKSRYCSEKALAKPFAKSTNTSMG